MVGASELALVLQIFTLVVQGQGASLETEIFNLKVVCVLSLLFRQFKFVFVFIVQRQTATASGAAMFKGREGGASENQEGCHMRIIDAHKFMSLYVSRLSRKGIMISHASMQRMLFGKRTNHSIFCASHPAWTLSRSDYRARRA